MTEKQLCEKIADSCDYPSEGFYNYLKVGKQKLLRVEYMN